MEHFKPAKYREIKEQLHPLPGGPQTRAAYERLQQGMDTSEDRKRIERFETLVHFNMEDTTDPEPESSPQQDLESLWNSGPTPVEDAARYTEIYHGLVKKLIQYQERIDHSTSGKTRLKRKTPFGKLHQVIDRNFINTMGNMAIRAQQELQDGGYQSVVNEVNKEFNIEFVTINPQPKIIFEVNRDGEIRDMRGGENSEYNGNTSSNRS